MILLDFTRKNYLLRQTKNKQSRGTKQFCESGTFVGGGIPKVKSETIKNSLLKVHFC